MQSNTYKLLNEEFGVAKEVLNAVSHAEDEIKALFDDLDDVAAFNQYKVLKAFQKNRISDMHFGWNTATAMMIRDVRLLKRSMLMFFILKLRL